MEKNLERLGKLLKCAGDSKGVRWNDPLTCSGLMYGYAADGLEEGIDVVTTVKEAMSDVCGGGLLCDQCKVYNALQVFVSDVEVVEMFDDEYSVKATKVGLHGMNVAQLELMRDILSRSIEKFWHDIKSGIFSGNPEDEMVSVYDEVRATEELYGVMTEYLK